MILFALSISFLGVEPPNGFETLFDGKTLTGWRGMPGYDPYKWSMLSDSEKEALNKEWTDDAFKHWRAESGELVNDGHGAYLTTNRDFGDIELLIEYKTVPLADSGIYLRATPQVQIWDTTEAGGKWNIGANKGSGGLYNNAPGSMGKDPLVHADRPFGEWNKFRIIQVGERTTVYLNDKLVVDHVPLANIWKKDHPLLKRGPIQLQTHGGEIRWRNIFVREIPSAEANEILQKHSSEGFESIFNGQSFAGWKGPIENYEVKDQSIVCKQGKGGFIFAEPEFKDCIVRFEYRMTPGGNSGIALRYPGKGRASMEGLCEIQLLDDDHPKYAKLDPRSTNGSAYGLASSHRGYARPVGEWNVMELTCKGQTVTVELNGTKILHKDLSPIDTFFGKRKRPGQNRESGHIAVCGHRDPVQIRGLKVKRL